MDKSGQDNIDPLTSTAIRGAVSAVSAAPERFAPGPAGLISFDGHVDPLTFLADLVGQFGDVVRYQTRFGPCFLFVHPEHVKTILHRENYRRASLVKMMLGEGLLASDGAWWRGQRRLMQPDFIPSRIAPFVPVITRETMRTASAWRADAREGKPVDVTAAMTRLTLRIIVQVLFSDELSDPLTTELCAAITQTINDLGNISWTVFGVPVRLTPSSSASFAASKQVIDAVCYDMIARRRALRPEERPEDLLTLLIGPNGDGQQMSDVQVRDEIVTMLVGGHETTALALAWAWKAIAEHPDIEAKLHKEVDAMPAGRMPELADLPQLSWARAIFQEAMRLYPPVWYMARVANEDDVIDGYAIPRGACVLVSAWFTQRHKDFWPEAERFDPGRFANPAVKPAHFYAYFPFGGGRHQCLGMHLALMEGTMILAQLARQFHLRPVEGQQIRPAPGITLRQSPTMRAHIEPRGAECGSEPSGSEAV